MSAARFDGGINALGQPITGETTVLGTPWNGTRWKGTRWTGGSWNGSRWTNGTWMGTRWTEQPRGPAPAGPERGRTGTRWTGTTWTGTSWSGTRWTGTRWTDSSWTGTRWTDGRLVLTDHPHVTERTRLMDAALNTSPVRPCRGARAGANRRGGGRGRLRGPAVPHPLRSAPWWLPLVVAVAFGVAERAVFHLEHRREAIRSPLEVPSLYALVS